jgi:hypothetical protein
MLGVEVMRLLQASFDSATGLADPDEFTEASDAP